jgi:hypothetical protein
MHDFVVLLKYIIISPNRAFEKINNEQYDIEVGLVFLMGSILPLIKAFSLDPV